MMARVAGLGLRREVGSVCERGYWVATGKSVSLGLRGYGFVMLLVYRFLRKGRGDLVRPFMSRKVLLLTTNQ